ncbi:MAG: hypothetical protein JWN02_1088, partial [Acidobacteria bacterium]|nr:hypothetical protein [Acidobacteriota bacterium]
MGGSWRTALIRPSATEGRVSASYGAGGESSGFTDWPVI